MSVLWNTNSKECETEVGLATQAVPHLEPEVEITVEGGTVRHVEHCCRLQQTRCHAVGKTE